MSTGKALLREICENPDDDATRLVFADWLDENGQPERAELIRVQCEMARLGHEDPRQKQLEKRAEVILRKHSSEWVSKLPWRTGVEWCAAYKQWRHGFKRGFVVQATFSSSKAFRDTADAVFAATPLEEVRFTRLTDRTVKPVAASPYLARVRYLDVGVLTFGTIGELNRPTNELGEAGGVTLLSSPHLTRLEKLDLDGNAVGDAGMAALAASPHLGRLRSISATANQIGPAGARALAQARLPGLLGITFTRNRIGDEGMIALANSALLDSLESLWVDGNGLTDASALALASSPHAAKLDSLNLSYNGHLTVAGVRALVDSPHLARLGALSVASTGLTPEEGEALKKRFRGKYFFWY
jgi:uncharacterized protein (TIGR02996 family)